MELTKNFVNNCKKIGVLRDFLCQAIDQIDAMEAENKWHRCNKPNEDGQCDLPPESGEYIVQVEFKGKVNVTSSEFDIDEPADWLDLHPEANVIQWRETPKAPE